MKTSKRNKLLGLALIGGFSLFSASNALAAAGDDISNRATLSYSVGTTAQPAIGSSPTGNTSGAGTDTVFREDRVVNFTVVEAEGATVSVAPDATLQVQRFDVTNDGNGTQDFIFASINRDGTASDPYGGINDNFDVTSSQVFVDTVLDGNFVPADDDAIFADQVAPGDTVRVFIVSTIPDNASVSNGDLAVMALVAQVADGSAASGDLTDAATAGAAIRNDDNNNVSPAGTFSNGATVFAVAGTANNIADNPLTEQIVFNDPAGTVDSTNVADIVQNGQASDDSSYTVQAANLTITKTSEVIYDPINLDSFTDIATPNTNNPKALPGAYIQYTITIENAVGAGSANLTTLADVINASGTNSVNLDVNLLDAGKALGATLNFPGDEENAIGDSIRIDTTLTGRTTPAAGFTYCTSAADADGCNYSGDPNGSVSVDFTNVPGMPVEGAVYAAGELKGGETVVVVFNVIVQ